MENKLTEKQITELTRIQKQFSAAGDYAAADGISQAILSYLEGRSKKVHVKGFVLAEKKKRDNNHADIVKLGNVLECDIDTLSTIETSELIKIMQAESEKTQHGRTIFDYAIIQHYSLNRIKHVLIAESGLIDPVKIPSKAKLSRIKNRLLSRFKALLESIYDRKIDYSAALPKKTKGKKIPKKYGIASKRYTLKQEVKRIESGLAKIDSAKNVVGLHRPPRLQNNSTIIQQHGYNYVPQAHHENQCKYMTPMFWSHIQGISNHKYDLTSKFGRQAFINSRNLEHGICYSDYFGYTN